MAIGDIIAKKRKEKNMTQQDLADVLNVSSKTVSKWETNRGLPEISMIALLSRALEVSTDELLGGFNSKKEFIVSPNLKYQQNNATIISSVINLVGCGIVTLSFALLKDLYELFWIFTFIGGLILVGGITVFFILRNRYTAKFLTEYQFNEYDKKCLRKTYTYWYLELALTILISSSIFRSMDELYPGDDFNMIIMFGIFFILLSIPYVFLMLKHK